MKHKNAMVRYMESVQEINSSYNLIAQKYNLSYNTLIALYIIHDYENVTQKMICDKLFFSKSTVHSIIIDLQKKDYIKLIQGNNNKEKYIIFTENGFEFISYIIRDTEQFENEVMVSIGVENFLDYLEQTETFAVEMIKQAELITSKGVKWNLWLKKNYVNILYLICLQC